MKAEIFIEGASRGANSKNLTIQCRKVFHKLLAKCGFEGRMPGLKACGSRGSTFSDFKMAHQRRGPEDYVAMWIDSEDPMTDIEAVWAHLRTRDGWTRPPGADDEQVLLMTTCMETLIVADRAACNEHYGHELQETALPPVHDLENRNRHDVQDKLAHATRRCSNAYAKGTRSFEPIAKLSPTTLEAHLPSFARTRRILKQKLR